MDYAFFLTVNKIYQLQQQWKSSLSLEKPTEVQGGEPKFYQVLTHRLRGLQHTTGSFKQNQPDLEN